MEEKIKIFLASDLLEKYLVGTTTIQESHQVERYISLYPEVKKLYEELQENLEQYAKAYAVKAPEGLKEKVIHAVNANKSLESRKFFKYAIAASFIAFLFAGTSYFFWNQNQNLKQENSIVNQQIKSLEENWNNKLENIRNQFIVLNNPDTKKYILKSRKAKNLKAIAYVNPIKKLSYINVASLPEIPAEKCFQMWAEVDGKLVSLGVINDANDKLLALPYDENAVSYNISIEPKGGANSASKENIISKISIQ